ncbi:hypothetical protein [Flavobacterium sp. N3904]|uniref:hypothetical protein n=1 Tax=Flavobacterium sp. N3904 TaxID=2986835 RepID=UPI0039B5F0BF
MTNFSGTGYVNTNAGNINFSIPIEEDGYYDVDLRFASVYSKKKTAFLLIIKNTLPYYFHLSPIGVILKLVNFIQKKGCTPFL